MVLDPRRATFSAEDREAAVGQIAWASHHLRLPRVMVLFWLPASAVTTLLITGLVTLPAAEETPPTVPFTTCCARPYRGCPRTPVARTRASPGSPPGQRHTASRTSSKGNLDRTIGDRVPAEVFPEMAKVLFTGSARFTPGTRSGI